MSNPQSNSDYNLEELIIAIARKVAKEEQNILAKEEIKDIIKELMPDLDKLIAEKVKKHLRFLLAHSTEKLRE